MTRDPISNFNLVRKEFVDRHQSALLVGEHIVVLPISAQHEERATLANRLSEKLASLPEEQRSTIQATALQYVSSFASNLDAYNLRLEEESVDRLVLATTDILLTNHGDKGALQNALDELGLSTLLARTYPDIEAQPMFPDFPRQVVDMSELEYRVHQALHYASTYGVEGMYACILGTSLSDVARSSLHVKEGYRPQVEATEKTRDDEAAHGMVEQQAVRLMASFEKLADYLAAALARPVRMSRGLLDMASWLYVHRAGEAMQGCSIHVPGGVAFKENGTEIVRVVARDPESSAYSIKLACEELLSNPMDVLKCFRTLVDERVGNSRKDPIGKELIDDNPAYEWQRDFHALINELLEGTREAPAEGDAHPAESIEDTHIPTRVKRGFAQALLAYPTDLVVQNIADAHPKVRNGVKYLSLKRFAAPDDYERIMAAVNGEVPSWNARAEQLWGKLDALNDAAAHATLSESNAVSEDELDATHQDIARQRDRAMRDLLAFYLQRPGVLLRTLTRFVRAGLTSEQVESCGVVETLADSASLATLLKVTAQFSVDELGAFSVDERGKLTRDQGDYAHRSDEERKLEEYAQAYAMVLLPALRRVFSRLAAADERLRALSGKHVFVDAGGFSLEGSLVIPNESGQKTAWPPAGMAYALPEADRLRFFTYWDDRAKRVDVDMHAVAVRDYAIRDSFAENVFSGKEMLQVGWNSNFNVSGITTSGDVTASVHAVEYIDIHVPETAAAGIRTISISNVIYAGADSWDDIDTAFCGCSVVGSDERDVRLFDRKNVVFRYDLTGKGRHEVTSVIDLKRGFARVHRGEGLGLAHATFTLALYVDMLLEACGAQRVESRDDAEAVLYVAPSEDGAWSLMGERFFVGAHE